MSEPPGASKSERGPCDSFRPHRLACVGDPTYVKAEIDANLVWKLAHRLSEYDNDNAPIGWGAYIPLAEWLTANKGTIIAGVIRRHAHLDD